MKVYTVNSWSERVDLMSSFGLVGGPLELGVKRYSSYFLRILCICRFLSIFAPEYEPRREKTGLTRSDTNQPVQLQKLVRSS